MLGLKLKHVSEKGPWKEMAAYSPLWLLPKHQANSDHSADKLFMVLDCW